MKRVKLSELKAHLSQYINEVRDGETTAMLLRDSLDTPLVFATDDRQQTLAAETLGFEGVGV